MSHAAAFATGRVVGDSDGDGDRDRDGDGDGDGAASVPARLVGLGPVVDRATRLVVLGSFPGAASLAARQYYGHPRNHFWTIVSTIWGVDLVGADYPTRLATALRHGVGLWDVYASCRREGSLDTAIEAAVPNDLRRLRVLAPRLHAVVHNGGESARAMAVTRTLGVEVLRLPSTSPANASWSLPRKLDAWRTAFVAHGVAAPVPPR